MTSTIILNGEKQRLQAGTILDLLLREALDPTKRGLAVALNGAVVSRRDWPETALRAGDRIEIVKPFSGG